MDISSNPNMNDTYIRAFYKLGKRKLRANEVSCLFSKQSCWYPKMLETEYPSIRPEGKMTGGWSPEIFRFIVKMTCPPQMDRVLGSLLCSLEPVDGLPIPALADL